VWPGRQRSRDVCVLAHPTGKNGTGFREIDGQETERWWAAFHEQARSGTGHFLWPNEAHELAEKFEVTEDAVNRKFREMRRDVREAKAILDRAALEIDWEEHLHLKWICDLEAEAAKPAENAGGRTMVTGEMTARGDLDASVDGDEE